MRLEIVAALSSVALAGMGWLLADAGQRTLAVTAFVLATLAWVVMFAAGESR